MITQIIWMDHFDNGYHPSYVSYIPIYQSYQSTLFRKIHFQNVVDIVSVRPFILQGVQMCVQLISYVVAGFVLFKNHHIFQNKEQKGEFHSLIKNTCHLFLRKNPIFNRLNITFNLKGMKLILSSSLCTISVQCITIFHLRATLFSKCKWKL